MLRLHVRGHVVWLNGMTRKTISDLDVRGSGGGARTHDLGIDSPPTIWIPGFHPVQADWSPSRATYWPIVLNERLGRAATSEQNLVFNS